MFLPGEENVKKHNAQYRLNSALKAQEINFIDPKEVIRECLLGKLPPF